MVCFSDFVTLNTSKQKSSGLLRAKSSMERADPSITSFSREAPDGLFERKRIPTSARALVCSGADNTGAVSGSRGSRGLCSQLFSHFSALMGARPTSEIDSAEPRSAHGQACFRLRFSKQHVWRALLRAAGGLDRGRTNMHELASGIYIMKKELTRA